MAKAKKIDLAFQANAKKDLLGFFNYVDSLHTVNDKRVAIQKAGFWYGNSTLKSLPVDPVLKANARKDLTAFFKWIDTQSGGNRVVNLMRAGLWYGDAGNTSVGTYVLYTVGAVAAVAAAVIGGPIIASALGGGGTAIKEASKKAAVETILTSTVTAETVKKDIKIPELIAEVAEAAIKTKKLVSTLKPQTNTSTVLTEKAASNLELNDLTEAETQSVFASFENSLKKSQWLNTPLPYILFAIVILFFIMRGK